jgi:hypothetical protein
LGQDGRPARAAPYYQRGWPGSRYSIDDELSRRMQLVTLTE